MYAELTGRLRDLMTEGFYPAAIEGTCQLQLFGQEDRGQQQEYPFYICCRDRTLSYPGMPPEKVDVTVRMNAKILKTILANLSRFDMRDPEVLLNVKVEGDVALAAFLFNLIKRPSKEIETLIRETESRARSSDYKEKIRTVRKVRRPTKEEMIGLIDASFPFVVLDALDDWELLSASLHEIKQKYGGVRLRPVVEEGRENYETLRDFIEKMENAGNNTIYTEGCGLPPAMWSKFQLPFFDWASLTVPQMWMGSGSGEKPCTALHRDCCHGMLANVFGRKKLIFFSPEQADSVYPVHAFNTYQPCLVRDVQAPDLEEYPLFDKTNPIEITIGPGELLIIPAFWFHCVYALDNVLSISSGIKWDAWEEMNSASILI